MRKAIKAIIAVLCIVLCMSVFFACDPQEKPDHTHDYTEIKHDTINHWYECSCGDKNVPTLEAHKDENLDGKCDVCEYEMPITAIKGVEFAIKGDNGGVEESLNGVNVIIASKVENHSATIADGKFKSEEVISVGTYTISADGYYSETIEITKDGIDMAVVTLYKVVNVPTSVKIENIEGVPTLIAEGMIPEIEDVEIGNVMLHYDASYKLEGASEKTTQHEYVANTSVYAKAYHFELALTELPCNSDTPWCWFHIYPYAEKNPTAESTPLTTEGSLTNLQRGDSIKVGDSIDYNGIRYTIHAENAGQENEGTQLAIDAIKHLGEITITGINFDSTNGAKLIVKGTYAGVDGYAVIHTDGNGRHYYGEPIPVKDGEIELEFDFTQVTYDDTPWCWFHIYLYQEEPTTPANFDQKIDIQRGNFFNAGEYTDIDGVRYAIVDKSQLTIQPKVAPTINNITSVEIKQVENKLVLVVKGTTSKDVACIKIHVDGNGDYYGDGVSATEGQEFELNFDLSQLDTAGKTYYFHLYTYADAEPADNSAKLEKLDVPRNQFATVQANVTFDYNDLRYTLQENDWNGIPIKVTNVPKTAVTSIAIETIEGVPTLIVKGTLADDVKLIKLHCDESAGDHYGNNVSKTAGEFELRYALTEVKDLGRWCWFHIYTYDVAEPADLEKDAKSIDLARGDYLQAGYFVNVDGIRYTVQDQSQVCIVVGEIPALDIVSITVDGTKLIVKGILNDDSIKCVKLHANGNDGHYYGDNVSQEAGKFELQFDLTQLNAVDKDYWFHIYTYTTENPADPGKDYKDTNLPRTPYVVVGQSFEAGGLCYEVINNDWNGFQLKASKFVVTSISVDGTKLVIKGALNDSSIQCVKLHTEAGGNHLYGNDVSTEAGKFELQFDLAQIAQAGNDCYFHVYTYTTATPEDLQNGKTSKDLVREPHVVAGTSFEAAGLKFTVQNNSWNQLQIKVTAA